MLRNIWVMDSLLGERSKCIDHQLILTGTLDVLIREYPKAAIVKAQTGKETLYQLKFQQFDMIVMDLSIPDQQGETAEIDTGIKLLQTLLQEYPHQNFMVQTSYVKALIRIKHEIDNHQGGFAIADKGLPEDQMLMRVNLALHGATHTKDIKKGIELKPEWLEVLRLAFEESLTDKAIADRGIQKILPPGKTSRPQNLPPERVGFVDLPNDGDSKIGSKIEITPPNAYQHFTLTEEIKPCTGKVRVTPVRAVTTQP